MGGLGLPLPLKLVPLPGLVLLEPRRTLGRRCRRAGVLPVEAAAALALALEVAAAVADAEAEAAGVAASESSMASVAATSSRAAASTLAVLEARRIRIWSAE